MEKHLGQEDFQSEGGRRSLSLMGQTLAGQSWEHLLPLSVCLSLRMASVWGLSSEASLELGSLWSPLGLMLEAVGPSRYREVEPEELEDIVVREVVVGRGNILANNEDELEAC